jgi:hypothetical protein
MLEPDHRLRAHSVSILGLVPVGLLAAAVGLAVFHREPPAPRRARPDARSAVTVEPATAPAQVLNRLREIRARYHDLAGDALAADPDDAPGPAHELDRLIRDLISDLDMAGTPTEPTTP